MNRNYSLCCQATKGAKQGTAAVVFADIFMMTFCQCKLCFSEMTRFYPELNVHKCTLAKLKALSSKNKSRVIVASADIFVMKFCKCQLFFTEMTSFYQEFKAHLHNQSLKRYH